MHIPLKKSWLRATGSGLIWSSTRGVGDVLEHARRRRRCGGGFFARSMCVLASEATSVIRRSSAPFPAAAASRSRGLGLCWRPADCDVLAAAPRSLAVRGVHTAPRNQQRTRAYSKRVFRTNCALRIKMCAPRISSGIYFLSTSQA